MRQKRRIDIHVLYHYTRITAIRDEPGFACIARTLPAIKIKIYTRSITPLRTDSSASTPSATLIRLYLRTVQPELGLHISQPNQSIATSKQHLLRRLLLRPLSSSKLRLPSAVRRTCLVHMQVYCAFDLVETFRSCELRRAVDEGCDAGRDRMGREGWRVACRELR